MIFQVRIKYQRREIMLIRSIKGRLSPWAEFFYFFVLNNFVYRSGLVAQTAKKFHTALLLLLLRLSFFLYFFNFHLIVSSIPFRLEARLFFFLLECLPRNAKEFNVSGEKNKKKLLGNKKKLNNLSSRDASTVHEYIVSIHLF